MWSSVVIDTIIIEEKVSYWKWHHYRQMFEINSNCHACIVIYIFVALYVYNCLYSLFNAFYTFHNSYLLKLPLTDVPSKPAPSPSNPTYEECEMKKVVNMQHNPSYAVPSQVTGSTEKKEHIKMADKGDSIATYETPS